MGQQDETQTGHHDSDEAPQGVAAVDDRLAAVRGHGVVSDVARGGIVEHGGPENDRPVDDHAGHDHVAHDDDPAR